MKGDGPASDHMISVTLNFDYHLEIGWRAVTTIDSLVKTISYLEVSIETRALVCLDCIMAGLKDCELPFRIVRE
jgi:hypothetical protein